MKDLPESELGPTYRPFFTRPYILYDCTKHREATPSRTNQPAVMRQKKAHGLMLPQIGLTSAPGLCEAATDPSSTPGINRRTHSPMTKIGQCIILAAAFLAGGALSGCGTINEKLAAGMSDAIPAWAGGLPSDAPPRPGTAQYDEYMRERERKRLTPAAERGEEAKPAPSGSTINR